MRNEDSFAPNNGIQESYLSFVSYLQSFLISENQQEKIEFFDDNGTFQISIGTVPEVNETTIRDLRKKHEL